MENAANTTNNAGTEYGIAFFEPTNNKGCQYNTIQHCTISLNKTCWGPFQVSLGDVYNASGIFFWHGTKAPR